MTLFMSLSGTVSAARFITPVDTLGNNLTMDEGERMRQDSLKKTHNNTATGFDATKYILEGRYRNYGDKFTHNWSDHLFLQGGFGVERIVPPDNDYKYDALMSANMALGKQISKNNTFRILLDGDYGYQRQKDYYFFKLGAHLDYLFSISDYFNGYDPARWFNASAILGTGIQYARASHSGITSTSPELHIGAQFHFFTGPQGYLAIEPYIGIGGDQMDLSAARNWKSYDVFYGVRLNYIYYLHNNLSSEARIRFMKLRKEANYLTADSIAQSWRMPWFVEIANGAYLNSSSDLDVSKSIGNEWTIGIGKWLSPAIGFRLSAFSRSSTWRQETEAASSTPYHPSYIRDYHSIYSGGRLDALFNPLALTRNYLWNNPFSGYLLFGVEFGQLTKYQSSKNLSAHSQGFTGGIHLATRLSQDLLFFIEPRYSFLQYRIPYSNVDWYQRFSEKGVNINVGFTIMMRGQQFRRIENPDYFTRHVKQITFGIMGGIPLFQTKTPVYDGTNNFNYNWGGYTEFHFNHIHAIRVTYEQLAKRYSGIDSYYDLVWDESIQNNVGVIKSGLWNHTLSLHLLSLSYSLNLTSSMSGFIPHRAFDLECFLGPTMIISSSDNTSLYRGEQLEQGHSVVLQNTEQLRNKFGAHLGFKLRGKITKHISVFLSPTFYLINDLKMNGLELPKVMGKLGAFETLNMGIQYSFQINHKYIKDKDE